MRKKLSSCSLSISSVFAPLRAFFGSRLILSNSSGCSFAQHTHHFQVLQLGIAFFLLAGVNSACGSRCRTAPGCRSPRPRKGTWRLRRGCHGTFGSCFGYVGFQPEVGIGLGGWEEVVDVDIGVRRSQAIDAAGALQAHRVGFQGRS